MQILKVAQMYCPYMAGGGLPIKVRAIAKALVQRGHGVTVLTADLGQGVEDSSLKVLERKRWGWRAEHHGVEAVYLRTWARYRAVTLNPGVINFCAKRLKSFDVVHLYGLYDLLGIPVGSFCRRAGIPYVVEPMGMFRPIVQSLWLKRFYLRHLAKSLIDGASRLIATSEQESSELIESGLPAQKITVRRNGIEMPAALPAPGTFRRQWGIASGSKVVLFLGRLVSKKSPDLLLEAFAGWLKEARRPESAVLVLAGPGEGTGYRSQLESRANDLGMKQRVLFTGPLYDEAKWAAYRDADVFILPSQNENFGNAAAEALSCNTPVIVTDRCGIAPLVEGRAGLVVPYDRKALQEGLARLLEDAVLRECLRAGCAQVARNLSWDEPVAAMENLYAELRAQAQTHRN